MKEEYLMSDDYRIVELTGLKTNDKIIHLQKLKRQFWFFGRYYWDDVKQMYGGLITFKSVDEARDWVNSKIEKFSQNIYSIEK